MYIDNVASIAAGSLAAEQSVGTALEAFDRAGVVAAREPHNSPLLGYDWCKERHEWRPKAKRFWRIANALKFVLNKNRRFSGRDVGHLVGHLTSIFLIKRELLSIFSVYQFIAESEFKRQPLWQSVDELDLALTLLPLGDMKVNLPCLSPLEKPFKINDFPNFV